jgi:hypothetical protein
MRNRMRGRVDSHDYRSGHHYVTLKDARLGALMVRCRREGSVVRESPHDVDFIDRSIRWCEHQSPTLTSGPFHWDRNNLMPDRSVVRQPALVRCGRGCRCLVCDVMESAEHNAGFSGHSIKDFERRNESADRDRFRRCG